MKITAAHGSGGRDTSLLIDGIFKKRFGNEILDRMEDAATLEVQGRIAVTTDSFVVTPLFFKGGDIGKLSVCGTVNDVLAVGGIPQYITCGFILEEGLEFQTLERVAESMAAEAAAAGVRVVAGDTKVIEGKGGMYINTCGIGAIPEGRHLSAASCVASDVIILSGTLGDHHACVLSARMGINNNISSDCACLNDVADALFSSGAKVRTMRDVTRGGLATALNEIAASSGCVMEIDEGRVPVDPEVRGFCGLLGLDPLYMGNEGKMVAIVAAEGAEDALAALRKVEHGRDAVVLGRVLGIGDLVGESGVLAGTGGTGGPGQPPLRGVGDAGGVSGDHRSPLQGVGVMGSGVLVRTGLGGRRRLDMLHGEGLPRIC